MVLFEWYGGSGRECREWLSQKVEEQNSPNKDWLLRPSLSFDAVDKMS